MTTVEELIKLPPFSYPVPADSMSRTLAFARELAAGAVEEHWGSQFEVKTIGGGKYRWNDLNLGSYLLRQYLEQKWNNETPNPNLLASLGYLAVETQKIEVPDNPLTRSGVKPPAPTRISYHLSREAYNLLAQAQPISIFISYRNRDSSAFALLLLSRMRDVGLEPFLDMTSLRGGDKWDTVLKDKVKSAEAVICLMGHTTLESEYVRQEIKLAHDSGVRIIPVFHNGYTDADLRRALHEGNETATILESRQGVVVQNERSLDYDSAIRELLNALGVAPQ
ncbi:MAG: toll/interleukin-1 receptor domain-containing protein [Chloroflexi bacterium]|nr:toll/interleukin-1 receptor domain-containing protein [Chloroflexota bacterium]